MMPEQCDLIIPQKSERYSVGVPMLKILICDDDKDFLQEMLTQVRRILQDLGKQARIVLYQDADAKFSDCDIALLDLDFAGKDYTGIDIARAIRNEQKDAIIIFVTNFPQYAPEGYEVNAFRYLMKTDISTKLRSYLTLAIAHLGEAKPTIRYSVSGEEFNFPLDDVLYIESQLHYVVLHTNTDSLPKEKRMFYANIGDLEKQLSGQGFLRIHRSYLVNMKYIQKYQCKAVTMVDGTCLRVSEKSYNEQKKTYLLWKGNR